MNVDGVSGAVKEKWPALKAGKVICLSFRARRTVTKTRSPEDETINQ